MKQSLSDIAETACAEHKAQQRPREFTVTLELVASFNPKIILEIGCADGGTLFAWTKICPEVYGITLPGYEVNDHGADVIVATSHSAETLARIEDKLNSRQLDMLFIDGDHSYDGVKADWEMYSPLVRKGGLVLFHDVANWVNEPEVVWFWRDLNKGYMICDALQSVLSVGFGIVEV